MNPLRGQVRYTSEAPWTTAEGAAVWIRPPTTLVPGSKPSAATDAAFDAMLEQTPAPTQKRQAALPIGETSNDHHRMRGAAVAVTAGGRVQARLGNRARLHPLRHACSYAYRPNSGKLEHRLSDVFGNFVE